MDVRERDGVGGLGGGCHGQAPLGKRGRGRAAHPPWIEAILFTIIQLQ